MCYCIISYVFCPAFSFLVQIPAFYAKSQSLYAEVSVLLSKWSAFYSEFIVWLSTCDCRTVRLPWGAGFVAHVKCIAKN